MEVINYLIISIIIITIGLIIGYFLKKTYTIEENEIIDKYTFDYLKEGIKDTLQNIVKLRPEELNLNKYEMEKRITNRKKLRKALRSCSCGDFGAKTYVKDYITNLLQQKFDINEITIDKVIDFNNTSKLSSYDKFSILLYQYKKAHGLKAMEKLLTENNLDQLKYDTAGNPYFDITKKDINKLYLSKSNKLDFLDKIEILSQYIYQSFLGHGVIDEIRDMKIDGVSVGVSGISEDFYNYGEDIFVNSKNEYLYSYDSVWIFFQGKSIRLSFLGFGSQRELERVCKNIYRYNSPGQLSEEKGHIENDMKDGSRIVVVRPPFSDSWAFLVRKHDNIRNIEIEELITDENKEVVIDAMSAIIKGCQITAITGGQGSGKTTLLKVLIKFINPTYNIRIQELIFELSLRKLYPFRNILTFKELPNVSGQEGLDLQKKTDGTVNIMGEVATFTVASWIIQMSQVASLFTMFTHHAKTTEDLVSWMRNALLKESGFSNERVAEEQVVRAINFDIHMNMSMEGHRYIERITEIVPIKRNENNCDLYQAIDIIVYSEGKYELIHKISNRAKKDIFRYLTDIEKRKYAKLFEEEDV
ncbi:ATPase, T2SS/T4P/T4SS family [Anaeromicropila herbilytica]|uniref:Pilus assembly protein CpaF n=1 Tax=Anaeromicropila herbilytica TaxID=2785025 RepID=A0A7R7EP11_9FIRM|nr:ATPase, T2SS/T4P/T4SS family [Anaeromicropila herbilytica]BCN32415.1 hypothetical protein bsdtb5_37100 [Anaeromicropila herbilytica]